MIFRILLFFLLSAYLPDCIGASTFIPPNFNTDLDDFITCLVNHFNIPALTVSVVANSATLFAKGYGYQDAEHTIPTSSTTLFSIGSVSKSFTSTLAGSFVQKGLLNLDDPVSLYTPPLTLSTFSPYINDHATMRDLLSHQTGITRSDFLWLITNASTNDWRSMVDHYSPILPPYVEFRQFFHYNNWMISAAAQVLETLETQEPKLTWEQMLQKLLTALNMTSTTITHKAARETGKAQTPFVRRTLRGPATPLPIEIDDVVDLLAPAGSINSNAEDMARYMNFHLSTTSSILNINTLYQLHNATSNTLDVFDSFYLTPSNSQLDLVTIGYGANWINSVLFGHLLVWHSGGTLGFGSLLHIYPNENFGVFISMPFVQPGSILLSVQLWVALELFNMTNWINCRLAEEEYPNQNLYNQTNNRRKPMTNENINRFNQINNLMQAHTEFTKPAPFSSDESPISIKIKNWKNEEKKKKMNRATSVLNLLDIDYSSLLGAYVNSVWPTVQISQDYGSNSSSLFLSIGAVNLSLPQPIVAKVDNLNFILYTASFITPAYYNLVYPQFSSANVVQFNTSAIDGTVYGVYVLLDTRPFPYFIPTTAATPASSTGESMGSSTGQSLGSSTAEKMGSSTAEKMGSSSSERMGSSASYSTGGGIPADQSDSSSLFSPISLVLIIVLSIGCFGMAASTFYFYYALRSLKVKQMEMSEFTALRDS